MRKMAMGRKITAFAVAMVMVFAMTSMAFASSTTTVTVNLQAAENVGGSWVMKDLTGIFPLEIEVASTATLYDALVQEDAANADLSITWKDVEILDPVTWLPTGEIGKAITSITYDGETYTNRDSYPTPNSYEGESWMYYLGEDQPTSTNDYPSLYLSQQVVSGTTVQDGVTVNNNELNLSFEHMVFSW